MKQEKTVLILGKSRSDLKAFCDRLEKNGYSTSTISSAEKALDAIKSHSYLAAFIFENMGVEEITSFLQATRNIFFHFPILMLCQQLDQRNLPVLVNEGLSGCLVPDFSDQDIKKILQRLEDSQSKINEQSNRDRLYRELYANLQDGFVEVDLKGRILTCNKTFEKISGYSQSELNRKTFWDFTPPKWHAREKEILKRQLIKNGTTGVYEKEYIRKDGSIIPIELSAYPILDGKGIATGMWAFVHDLTQSKQREEEIKKRHDLIIEQQKALVVLSHLAVENLLDSLQALTARAASAMRCERVSIWSFENEQKRLACLDLYERSKNQHSQEESLGIESFPRYFESLKKNRIISAGDARKDPTTREFTKSYLIPKGITSMLDCSIIRQDDLLGVICFEHTGPIRAWTTEEQNFAASLADLVGGFFERHERLEAEKNLRTSEERYRSIFESSTIAIAELNFSNYFQEIITLGLKNVQEVGRFLGDNPDYLNQILKNILIKDANPAFLNLFSIDNIEDLKTAYDLISGNFSKKNLKLLLEALTSDKPYFEGETEILTKNGQRRQTYFHMSLPRREKNQVDVFLNMLDISTRIQTEDTLKRKLQEITALHGIALASAQSNTVDELIEKTTLLLGETLFPDNFGVYIVDESEKTITPHPSYRGVPTITFKLVEPVSKGITGRAVTTGLPQRVTDVTRDKDYIAVKSDTRSELAVPIKINGKILGVVNTESALVNGYSEADENFLVTFANQLALAIERMRLLEAQQRQTREMTALYETAVSISGVLDVEKLIQRMYLQISDLFPLDSFLLALNEPDTDEIHISAAMQENRVVPELIDQRYPISNSGLIGWVIQNQKMLLLADMKTDPLPVKPVQFGKPNRSWLGVPLISRGQMLGAVSIHAYDPLKFNENHARLLESMAAQMATSLENALLAEQTQNHIQRLSALHDIDLVINSSLDLRVTMNILLDQVIEKLKVDAASVMLLNPRSQLLEYAAGRGFRTRKIEDYRLRLGEGLSGQAAMERHLMQSLNLSEMDENSAYPTLLSDEGFLSYYSVPLIAKGQVKGVLDIFNRSPLLPDQEWINFLETLAGQAAIAIDNTSLLEDLNRSNIELTLAYDTTLEGWSRALDLRDKETEGHTQRVVDLTLKIARGMGMNENEMIHLRRGALLHDIGKMGIPDEILLKPGPLTIEEWAIMHKHPQLAFDLLNPIVHLKPSIDIPYCHHEHWDGSGYPRGLKGEQIPLGARIFSVVDVWDALTSDRPYRKAWPSGKAIEYIQAQKGIQFDPKVVELFSILVKKT
jgi:PAS domain S-box-containing protein